MSPSELALAMLKWEQLQREADKLRGLIEDAVMDLQQSQTVGAVKATYSGGRKSYDYVAAVNRAMQTGNYPDDILDPFTETIVKTDYRKAALDGLGIDKDAIPFTQSAPSVSLKLAY